MPATFSRFLLTAGLVAGLLQSAPAQTARIAHFSHGGSAATLALAEPLDNFGLYTEEIPEKFTKLNDSIAQVEGQQRVNYRGPWSPIKWQQQYHSAHDVETAEQAIKKLRKRYPKAKFVGFEPMRKAKRKKAAIAPMGISTGPSRPSGSLLALLLGLAGAGWLLGKRRPAALLTA